MSLRWRLTGALLLVVVVAVTGGTAAHLAEISRRLEEQLQQQLNRVVSSIETEMEQTGQVLDEEVMTHLDPAGTMARSVGVGRLPSRYFSARNRLQSGRLEILKVLADDGSILSSGHWPASFGALDAHAPIYRGAPGSYARLVDETTPTGSAPSLQRWAQGEWPSGRVTIVAGRFLHEESLEKLRARTGADLLALCRPETTAGGRIPCATVKNPKFVDDETAISDEKWTQNLVLSRVPLGAGDRPPTLVVGLDRSPIDQVRAGIVNRALVVGALSILLATIIGVLLAARLMRPVEALAQAAGRLAEGDLQTRVEMRQSGGPEVTRLITSFNRMAADIERSQTRLKQAERVAAWREIARGLAHELKNPLTPILGAMDILRRARSLQRPDFDEILQEQSSAVVEEVMRLKELADAFSRFARLPDPRPEPIRLQALLDHAAALYAPEDGKVVVLRDYEEDAPCVVADRTQLMTALTNLLKNAVEAMEGEGRLRLRLHARAADDGLGVAHIEISIEDSGAGIDPEIRDRLFMPYVTTKGSRGTGLGLALVHRIVAEHGGSIEATDGETGGACFRLRIPLVTMSPTPSVMG